MPNKHIHLCFTCINLWAKTQKGYWGKNENGYRHWFKPTIWYACNVTNETINKVRERCKNYIGMGQITLGGEKIPMVKIDEIPEEAERVDLSTLPAKAELKYVGEVEQEASSGKTGGLIITYEMRNGKTFPQKYSQVSGKVFKAACKRLKIKETIELGQAWYEYELTPMRMGYPRMIPIKKV